MNQVLQHAIVLSMLEGSGSIARTVQQTAVSFTVRYHSLRHASTITQDLSKLRLLPLSLLNRTRNRSACWTKPSSFSMAARRPLKQLLERRSQELWDQIYVNPSLQHKINLSISTRRLGLLLSCKLTSSSSRSGYPPVLQQQ